MRCGIVLLIVGLIVASGASAADPFLYRVITIRAAPGELSAWLDAIDAIRTAYVKRGDRPPYVLRHTQGDHWDLMLIEPWESFVEYLAPKRMAKRQKAAKEMALLRRWLDDAPAFREDLFALGPAPEELDELFDKNRFYHVEMFYALPYKRGELLRQREMENDYLARTGQPTNTIWVGISGSDVDVFTIGFHADHAAFAAGSSMTEEERDKAAREAGFDGLDRIAPYLRSLIGRHQDTLAVPVD
jgi:hypothetical protein